MAKKPTKKNAKKKKPRINKRLVWYKHFTNQSNPVTFLNQTASAKAAGYKCRSDESFASVGSQNFQKLKHELEIWFDENSLSLTSLKMKHTELLECQKTVFQKIKGHIGEQDLGEGIQIVAESHKMASDGKGDDSILYDDGDTLLAINVADPEIQRRALDMAYKVKGTYAPVKHKKEHSGPGGGPIETKWTDFPQEPKTVAEWEAMREEAENNRNNVEADKQA